MGKMYSVNAKNQGYHTTVCGMFFDDNKVLIIEKADPAYKRKFSVVAGHVEENETIEDALKREISEELNIVLTDNYELLKVFKQLDDSCRYGIDIHDWYVFDIKLNIDIEKINFDKEEIISLQWIEKEELPKYKNYFTPGSKSMLTALGYF